MDQTLDPCRSGGLGHRRGALGLDRGKGLAPGGVEDAHEIDHRVRSGHGGGDRGRVAQVGLDDFDLADIAHHLDLWGQVRTADRHADAIARLGQSPDRVATDKSAAAENRHLSLHGQHLAL